MDEQNMNAAQLLRLLASIEVTTGYEPDFRRLCSKERQTLAAIMQRTDGGALAKQIVVIRRMLAAWPETTRRRQ